ncbi:EGF-like repeat and discoidin I-like domain-containing protein 3 isoform X1 [Montipora foliosa]|uniref:EGF-like repeat and discoidin I-like domain-containing protein 3 isoform X1 n=1 Tax=Montipora foliosa TaxID=591990 RepID=UPI0035F1E33D
MDYTVTKAFVLLFGCFCILIPQIISRDSTFLSSSATSRANRRLKGFTFKSLRVDSVVSCGLRCQRDSRCVSLNFVQTLSSDQGKITNVCELNEREAVSNSGDLEYDEESVYIQLFDKKAERDCQLAGCLNGGSCVFAEELRAFRCLCKDPWTGQYCQECTEALGMESKAIKDFQISASSSLDDIHRAQFARLHSKWCGRRPTGRLCQGVRPSRHPGQGGRPSGQGGKPQGCKPPGSGHKPMARAWVAGDSDKNPWLQVDLQNAIGVIGIATQGGSSRFGPGWVTKYKIQYREASWQPFKIYKKNGDRSETTFQGNTDERSVVYKEFNPMIVARYIRVLPVYWFCHASMRIELYGSCKSIGRKV